MRGLVGDGCPMDSLLLTVLTLEPTLFLPLAVRNFFVPVTLLPDHYGVLSYT